jgi:hypothetical protein
LPYAPHWLLSFGGDLCEGQEIWANNIRFATASDLPFGPFDENAQLAGFAADIRALALNVAARWPSDVRCTWVKFNPIDANGRYASLTESNTLFLQGTDIIVGQGTTVMPPQASMCITWRTAFARGRGSKGRIFAPRSHVSVAANGRVNQGQVDGMAQAYRDFIVALNDLEGPDGTGLRVVVASGVNGALNPVERVEVGNVIDTQRRRRNSLVEAFTGINV